MKNRYDGILFFINMQTVFMQSTPEENKKNKQPDNKIREGTEDDGIHKEKKKTDERSYPKLSIKDNQHKTQPEFLDNEPNREDNET
jgi:hypothetical protein